MPTIREENKNLSKAWGRNEAATSDSASILYDSDDDGPLVGPAKVGRPELENRLDDALKGKVLSKLSWYFPRSKEHPEIARRRRIAMDIENNTREFNMSASQRKTGIETSSLMRYAFKSPESSNVSSPMVPANLHHPYFTWTPHFRKLKLKDTFEADMWTELRYNEAVFRTWWRQRNENEGMQEGWYDMTRLARRVVIHILEYFSSQKIKDSRHLVRLKMIAERSREIALYEVILCYNILPQWLGEFQELFECTVPIIYLVSGIVKSAWSVPANGIAENMRIEHQLQSLDPYVRELRDRCYLFGDKIGFNIHEFEEEFKQGAIFDFDAEDAPTIWGEDNPIQLDRRLAGKTKNEYLNRIGSIGNKQSKVNEIIHYIPDRVKTVTDVSLKAGEKLNSKVLEDIGLQRLDDIIYGTRLMGSGGYTDVFEMKRSDDSKPAVAVKIYRPNPKTAKRLEREARVWIQIRHVLVAPLLGFVIFDSVHTSQPCLVSQLYHTNLKQLVKDHSYTAEASGKRPLTVERRMKFLRNIVFGLDFLHAMGIAHGDLRAANILVTNDLIDDPSCYAVLNDFGMAEFEDADISHVLDGRDLSSVNQKTNDYWLAPELVEGFPPKEGSLARVTKLGDVYAFGVVFLEVVYEKDPYDGTLYSIRHAKSIGELPAKREGLKRLNEDYWAYMKRCWDVVDNRWDIVACASELTRLLNKFLLSTTAEWVTEDMSGLPNGFTQYKM